MGMANAIQFSITIRFKITALRQSRREQKIRFLHTIQAPPVPGVPPHILVAAHTMRSRERLRGQTTNKKLRFCFGKHLRRYKLLKQQLQ